MRFNCPTCSQLMECPDDVAGKTGRCPKCRQKFVIPVRANKATPTDAALFSVPVGSSDKQPKQESDWLTGTVSLLKTIGGWLSVAANAIAPVFLVFSVVLLVLLTRGAALNAINNTGGRRRGRTCNGCNGSGHWGTACTICFGSGLINQSACPSCGGNGLMRCSSCDGYGSL